MTRWKSCKIRRWYYCSVLLLFKIAFFSLKSSTNANLPVMFLPPLVGWQVMSDLQMQQMKGCFAVQLLCNDRCHTELHPLLFKGVFWSSPTAAAPLNVCHQLRGAVGKLLIHLSGAQEGNLHYICIHMHIIMKHLFFWNIFFLKNKKILRTFFSKSIKHWVSAEVLEHEGVDRKAFAIHEVR